MHEKNTRFLVISWSLRGARTRRVETRALAPARKTAPHPAVRVEGEEPNRCFAGAIPALVAYRGTHPLLAAPPWAALNRIFRGGMPTEGAEPRLNAPSNRTPQSVKKPCGCQRRLRHKHKHKHTSRGPAFITKAHRSFFKHLLSRSRVDFTGDAPGVATPCTHFRREA